MIFIAPHMLVASAEKALVQAVKLWSEAQPQISISKLCRNCQCGKIAAKTASTVPHRGP